MKLLVNLLMSLFLVAIGHTLLMSQANYDHTWLHGYTTDEMWPEFFWGIKLDFNEDPMAYEYYEKRAGFNYSATSFSDSLGKLMFYTNGCEIFDANHEVVENSYPLAPSEMHDFFCVQTALNRYGHGRGYANSQLVSAVPNLRRADSYLVFLGKYRFNVDGQWAIGGTIVMAEVIKEDNGLKVVNKDVEILHGNLSGNMISVVKHANGLDWWVLTFDALTNRYYSLLIEENEMVHVESDTIGGAFLRNEDGWGQVNISPNGKKVVRHSPVGGTMLFDFDRETGRLSNYEYFHLGDDPLHSNVFGSAAFSPDSKLLYVGTITQLFQIEVDASDKLSSAILIDTWDGSLHKDFWYIDFYHMQNAPDCKIYMIPSGTVPFLHIIHEPNKRGLDCNFEQRAIEAPDYSIYPTHLNYPNYRLGTEWEDWCDEESVSVHEYEGKEVSYQVYPNPASDRVQVIPGVDSRGHEAIIEIIDLQGRTALIKKEWLGNEGVSLPIFDLHAGSYILRITSSGNLPYVEKLKIIK